MQYTEHLGLKKPESTDFYDVDHFNSNADVIDAKLKDLENNKAEKSHTHIKSQVGLENVDNTSDLEKPVSVPQQTALDEVENNGKISNTVTGRTITATNSADAPVIKLEVDGKTEQFTTTGKNLMPRITTNNTVNGIAFTTNEDLSLSFKGTTTSNAEKRISNDVPISAGNYIFSIQNYDVTKYIVTLKLIRNGGTPVWVEFGETDKSFTINDGDTIEYTSVVVKSGATVDTTIYPMIRLSSITDGTYEPYTNGASPSPEYPQDIKGAGDSGNVEVTVTGKNELENKAQTTTVNGVTFTVNADKSVTANGKATGDAYFNIAEKITIPSGRILSGCPNGGSNTTYSLHAWYNSSIVKIDSGAGVIFTEDFTANEIYIAIRSGVTVNNLTFYPMIRKAEITDNTYEPYKKSQTVKIPVTSSLYKGDSVTLKNGKKEEYRENRMVVFDGSEDGWERGGTNTSGKYLFKIPMNVVNTPSNEFPSIYSDKFKAIKFDSLWGCNDGISTNSNTHIAIYYDAVANMNVTDFKQYLSQNPITVVYKLAEPTTEVIETDIDLSAYCNVTHITNNCDASMEVEYFVNSANGNVVADLQEQVNKTTSYLNDFIVVEEFSAFVDLYGEGYSKNKECIISKRGYIPIMATCFKSDDYVVCHECEISKSSNDDILRFSVQNHGTEDIPSSAVHIMVLYVKAN